jgi:hypothetical protein
MSYGDLIKDTFRVTLRNRYLWFFGFFVGTTFPSGGGGGNFDQDDFEQSNAGLSQVAAQVGPGELGGAAFIVGLVVVAVLIVLFFIVMAIISQGALSESVAAVDRGEGRRFGSTFRSGLGSFWRVLGYYILFFLIGLGLLVAIGIPIALLIGGTFAATESLGARISVSVVVGLLGIVALIAVFIPLSVIGQYSLREIVVRGERIVRSVGTGYGIFRRNIGKSLLLWLIHLGLMIGIGIAMIIVLLIIGLILFAPTIVLAISEYATAAVVSGIIAGLILLPIFLVASGAAGTFGHAYWTLAYLRLTARPAPPARTEAPPDPV